MTSDEINDLSMRILNASKHKDFNLVNHLRKELTNEDKRLVDIRCHELFIINQPKPIYFR